MLGTLDDEQPLAIIEALVRADSMAVMGQVEQAASRGADWGKLAGGNFVAITPYRDDPTASC